MQKIHANISYVNYGTFCMTSAMESVMNSLTILCHFTLTDTLEASSQGNY